MTGKKIIANLLLLLSITGLNGYFSRIQAVVSDDEWTTIRRIEGERHNPRLIESLTSDITAKIRLKENTNIVFYYQSILCKLLGGSFDISSINFSDKTSYKKEFFATLIYRILAHKIDNNLPINPEVSSCISDFLTQKVITKPDDFINFNDMDKVNIIRICLICNEHYILDRTTLSNALEIIKSFVIKNGAPPKLLITLAKIPNIDTHQRIATLDKALTALNNLGRPPNDSQCIEALIALGNIPGPRQSTYGVECLKRVIRALPENDPQHIKALIALGNIPGPQQSTYGVECLKRVIKALPENDPQRIKALIALGKIPHNTGEQIKALNEAIKALNNLHRPPNDPQRIEALIALGKIPHNTGEQIKALNEAIGALPENDSQRIEALIALGNIPYNTTDERIKSLNEAIKALDNLHRPPNDPQRIKALIALGEITGPQQSTYGVECLKRVIKALPENGPQRIKALIALGKIPHNTGEQIKALNEAIAALPENDPQRIEALIALGNIPHNTNEQIEALNEAIKTLNNLHRPPNDPQRIKALISYARIPGPQQLTNGVKCLEEALEVLPDDSKFAPQIKKIADSIIFKLKNDRGLSPKDRRILDNRLESIIHRAELKQTTGKSRAKHRRI